MINMSNLKDKAVLFTFFTLVGLLVLMIVLVHMPQSLVVLGSFCTLIGITWVIYRSWLWWFIKKSKS